VLDGGEGEGEGEGMRYGSHPRQASGLR
jgi:hypothetical protein